MTLAPIDLLFNALLMLFWLRVWNRGQSWPATNPYLTAVGQAVEPVLSLFQLCRIKAAGWIAPLLAWFILILFRGIALPALNPDGVRQAWRMKVGFEAISPAVCGESSLFVYVAFSFLSFAIFLFQVWCFSLLFLKGRDRETAYERPAEFLWALARPLSEAAFVARPLIVLVFGVLIIAVLNTLAAGSAALTPESISGAVSIGRWAVVAVAGAVDILLVIRSLLLILIVGSWLMLFIASETLALMLKEWLDFLLAPFRFLTVRVGPIDLTALVAFMALGVAHWFLKEQVLVHLYLAFRKMGTL